MKSWRVFFNEDKTTLAHYSDVMAHEIELKLKRNRDIVILKTDFDRLFAHAEEMKRVCINLMTDPSFRTIPIDIQREMDKAFINYSNFKSEIL